MTSDTPRQEDAGRTVTIYDTCRQFEVARASGSDPRIEDFLQEAGNAERGILLRELLCVEIAARRQRDEQPSPDEYHSRFPDDGPAVNEAFERASAATLEKGVAPTLILTPPAGAKPAASLGDMFSASGQTEMLGGGPRGPAAAESGGVRDYDLLEKLGEGGMGVVYRARQRSADRIVAVKVIRPDRIQNLSEKARQAAIDRFRNEAHATARIDHDNIVTVYEVGEYEGRHFFSMSYVSGRSLSQLTIDGALSSRMAAHYMQQVASAIHAAHLHGILHRDLKPQNVLVDEDAERAMVADFGLAKLIEDESQLTREGEIMGTPQYMSPEQTRDAASVTTLTDVYALGATLYHLIAGQPPFHGGTAVEVLRRVIDEPPAAPSTLKEDVDPDLETICLKCMEKEPQQRYASALEVADELTRYLEGRPIQARPLGSAARFQRWCRRNPLVASLAGTAVMSVLVALVAAAVGYVETTAALEKKTEALGAERIALKAEKIAREDAEGNYREALTAVDGFITAVSEDVLLGRPGMQRERERLLLRALEYYKKILARPSSDDTAREELAATHFRVGRINQKLKSREDALAAYLRAREMQEELLREKPKDVARLTALGKTLNGMGAVSFMLGQNEDAERLFRETIRLRHLAANATGGREDGRLLANAEMNLGNVLRATGRYDDARKQMIAANDRREQLFAKEAGAVRVHYDLGRGYYNLGLLEIDAKEHARARQHVQRAIDIFDKLSEQESTDKLDTLMVRLTLVNTLMFGAELYSGKARILAYQRALRRIKDLRRGDPNVDVYRSRAAEISISLGAQYAYKDPFAEVDVVAAIAHFRYGLDALKSVRQRDPKRTAILLAGAGQCLDVLEKKAPSDPAIVELKQMVSQQREELEDSGK